MLKKIILTTLGLIVIVGVLGGIKGLQIAALMAAGAQYEQPAETVSSAPAREETWQPAIPAVGSLTPVQGVTVAAELPGKIVKIAFESGAFVEAGQVLVELDTSSEVAQLRAAEAAVALAKVNLDRSRDLLKKATIAQSELDLTDAQFKQASAQLENIQAVIAKKTVRAPFAGRLGIRSVHLGQFVREGEAIASLQSLDPIYVDFSVPQQRLSQLAVGLVVQVRTDVDPGRPIEGRITAIEPAVDSATRNVRVQATLENKEEKLRAGMFAQVEVVLPTSEQVLVVPLSAVLSAPYGDSLFVVEESREGGEGKARKVARQRTVRLGQKRGDFVVVLSGIKAGEEVVTSGTFKLRNNSPITIDNSLAPKAQLAPKLKDS